VNKALDALQPYVDEIKRTDGDLKDIARSSLVLSQLLRGEPLPEEWWADEKRAVLTHVWRPIPPNSLAPGDIVRVKQDAYTGHRSAVNGMVGRVSALRGGVIVNYDDQQGATMGDRHMLDKLERQVPIRRGATK
jgi:hypothetical protein